MSNPYLVIGGIAVGIATATFALLQVPGWVAAAQDAAAVNDLAQVAVAQATAAAEGGSFALEPLDGLKVTTSGKVRLAVAVSPDGDRWAAAAVSESGRVLVRSSVTTELYTSEHAYEPGEFLAGGGSGEGTYPAVPAPPGVTVSGTATNPDIVVTDRPQLSEWEETSRNTILTPSPTKLGGSTWQTLGNTITADPDGGLRATVLAGGTPWVPYVFSGLSSEAYEPGDVVTLAMTYRVDSMEGSEMEQIRISPHLRSTNHYFLGDEGSVIVRPVVFGETIRVAVRFVVPVAVKAMDLDLAIVGMKSDGKTYAPVNGISWAAREAVIERGDTGGVYYDGSTPDSELVRHKWQGAPAGSVSIKETRRYQ